MTSTLGKSFGDWPGTSCKRESTREAPGLGSSGPTDKEKKAG